MEDQFLDRLYQIKPFKIVESPESLKKKACSVIEDAPHLENRKKFSDNKADHTPNKEN